MLKTLTARLGPAMTLRMPPNLARSLVPVLALAVVGTALALMLMWRDQAAYKPVFGQREKVAISDMMAVLDAEHIAYRLHPESGQVLVPEAQLGKVRMLLAAKGVTAKLPNGLELMDRNDPLGVSQFVQDVRFRRGLEGELAQSMMALDAVEQARVHLSIAKSSSFVMADGQKSSASVVLTMKPGRVLTNEQIAAAINLVAGSVASLDPQRVSLVDQAGNLLSARVDLSEGAEGIASQGNDAAKHYQDEARRNVRDILAPVLGEDSYRLSVTAEVDNDRVQETREQYGDAPKVTNEAMREEMDRQQMAMGVPGSLSNRPVNAPADAASGADNGLSARKNATTRQYAYDRSITQTRKARGRLARMNVAVVLSNAVGPTIGGPGGRQWTNDDLRKIERVLSSGLGLNVERGDKLTVSPMNFPAKPVAQEWYEQRDTLIDIGGYIAYGLALILGYFLLARPVLRLAKQALTPAPLVQQQAEPMALPNAEAVLAVAQEAANATPALANEVKPMPVVPLLENFELPPPGSPVDVLVDHLKVLAAKEPERVAEVVKQWVQKKAAQ